MKYLVIGLGNLGRAIAESLTRIGNEVIGVDINPHKTEAVKHTISGAISLDTTASRQPDPRIPMRVRFPR